MSAKYLESNLPKWVNKIDEVVRLADQGRTLVAALELAGLKKGTWYRYAPLRLEPMGRWPFMPREVTAGPFTTEPAPALAQRTGRAPRDPLGQLVSEALVDMAAVAHGHCHTPEAHKAIDEALLRNARKLGLS